VENQASGTKAEQEWQEPEPPKGESRCNNRTRTGISLQDVSRGDQRTVTFDVEFANWLASPVVPVQARGPSLSLIEPSRTLSQLPHASPRSTMSFFEQPRSRAVARHGL